jgi:hypothetical protein
LIEQRLKTRFEKFPLVERREQDRYSGDVHSAGNK